MSNIRTIDMTGRIFYILIPGVFLLVNIISAVLFFPINGYAAQQNVILKIFSDPVIGLVLVVSLGYFLGVLLRCFRLETHDKLAGWMLRRYYNLKRMFLSQKQSAHKEQSYSQSYSKYADDNYFIKWIDEVIVKEKLSEDVKEFYDKIWKTKGGSKTFIHFCKLLVISHDERAASEICADEALCRHIAGILYAIFMSSALFLTVFMARLILRGFDIFIFCLLIGYLIAFVSILINFRLMRLKEVQTVFFATYKNRELFHDTPNVSNQS